MCPAWLPCFLRSLVATLAHYGVRQTIDLCGVSRGAQAVMSLFDVAHGMAGYFAGHVGHIYVAAGSVWQRGDPGLLDRVRLGLAAWRSVRCGFPISFAVVSRMDAVTLFEGGSSKSRRSGGSRRVDHVLLEVAIGEYVRPIGCSK